jgi:hypothetical protein
MRAGIIFGQGSKGILRVSATGGKPEVLAKAGYDPGSDTASPRLWQPGFPAWPRFLLLESLDEGR